MPERGPHKNTSNITPMEKYETMFRISGFVPRTLIGGSVGTAYGVATIEFSILSLDIINKVSGEPLTPEEMYQL